MGRYRKARGRRTNETSVRNEETGRCQRIKKKMTAENMRGSDSDRAEQVSTGRGRGTNEGTYLARCNVRCGLVQRRGRSASRDAWEHKRGAIPGRIQGLSALGVVFSASKHSAVLRRVRGAAAAQCTLSLCECDAGRRLDSRGLGEIRSRRTLTTMPRNTRYGGTRWQYEGRQRVVMCSTAVDWEVRPRRRRVKAAFSTRSQSAARWNEGQHSAGGHRPARPRQAASGRANFEPQKRASVDVEGSKHSPAVLRVLLWPSHVRGAAWLCHER